MRAGRVVMLGALVAFVQCRTQPSVPPGTMGPIPGPGFPAPGILDVPAPPPVELKAFEVVRLLGPYQRLDEICLQPSEVQWDHTRCGADVPGSAPFFEGATVLEAASDPFLEVRLAARNDYADVQAVGHGFMSYHLGIRTREGWFVLPEFAQTQEPDFASHHEWLVVAPMRLFRVSDAAPPLLELVYWEKMADDDRGSDDTHAGSSRKLVLCGFASDRRPRCTAPTLVGEELSLRRISTDAVLMHSRWELDVRYAPGQVYLALVPDSEDSEVPTSLLGTHPLDFDMAATD